MEHLSSGRREREHNGKGKQRHFLGSIREGFDVVRDIKTVDVETFLKGFEEKEKTKHRYETEV